MEAKQTISSLRKVFGPFSQDPPGPTRAEIDAADKAKREAAAVQAEKLPAKPKVDSKTSLVLVPSVRVDGSSVDPPWTVPEPILWDLLRTAELQGAEVGGQWGLNGVLPVYYLNHDGEQRSGVLRFDTVGREHVYRIWGAEYMLDPKSHDLLRREQAAYEVAKACGMEDLVAPVAARKVDPALILGAGARERLAKGMRVSTELVDEKVGAVALLQTLPKSSENFVEFWATLGPDEVNRWIRASDRLRHSLYRAIALDFLLGTGDRSLTSLLYNRTLDSVVVYDLGLSFPHPGYTAEKYLRLRASGWGREPAARIEDAVDPAPAHGRELFHLSRYIQEDLEYECTRTFKQVADGFTDEIAYLVGRVLLEAGVPPEGVAGFFARIAFLSADQETVLRKPGEFTRNVLVPMRRGYGFGEGRNQHVVEYVSSAMSSLEVKKFNFPKSIQVEVTPEITLAV